MYPRGGIPTLVEIATCGTCCTYAKELGHDGAAELLGRTLDEEKKADQLLTQIATGRVNEQAIAHLLTKLRFHADPSYSTV